ncbi:MAG TPA: class II aldolase/adducin family protein [Spirochaetales bacterium]|nr:class II aldolase/adducin family protein [Spirochaetales bacterium]
MGQHNAVLLPNHGALSVGETMKKALKVSRVLEKMRRYISLQN